GAVPLVRARSRSGGRRRGVVGIAVLPRRAAPYATRPMTMDALIILPTYNERDNLPGLLRAILAHEGIRVMEVDDGSPDGTGALADAPAREFPGRVEVGHRTGARGLGRSYVDGLQRALRGTADVICQMDAD